MKRYICLLLPVLCLLLTACDPEPSPDLAVPIEEMRAQEWAEDIEYLREQYREQHRDPFYSCPEEEFDRQLDQLSQEAGLLSASDIYFELSRILAGMGDIHTAVLPPDFLSDRLFPVTVQYFGDKLYVSGYLEGYEQFEPYLLHEIVAVNGVDIRYLRNRAESILSPTNSWYSREIFSRSCFIPAFFDWAGCDHREGYAIQLLNDHQEVESVELPVLSPALYTSALNRNGGKPRRPENWESLFSFRGGNWREYYSGKNGGYFYVSISEMSFSYPEACRVFVEEIDRIVQVHPDCRKLVIDLRQLSDGKPELVKYFRERIHLLQESSIEQTYVLTGGLTGFAAMPCIAMLREELDAVVVGEPTAEFTSFFGWSYPKSIFSSVRPIILPHSRLSIRTSNTWYEEAAMTEVYLDEDGKLYEWENTVLPDVFVYQDIDDIRQGRDSLLAWVLDQ